MDAQGFLPLSRTLPFWPADVFGDVPFLDEIGVREFAVAEGESSLTVSGTLLWYRELAVDLPALPGFSVAFLSEGGHTAVPFQVQVLPEPALRLPSLSAALRISSGLLRPVERQDGRWVRRVDAAGRPRPAEIRLEGVGLKATLDGSIEVQAPAGAPALGLGAVEIGDTGVVLEIDGVAPYLSDSQPPPPGAQPGFRGVAIESVRLHLPPDLSVPILSSEIAFENMLLGTGGVSGTIRGSWTPAYEPTRRVYSGPGAGTLFGIPFALRSLSLTFTQNIPTASSIRGELVLPFFDHPVGVEVGLSADGGFTVGISAVQPAGAARSPQGLLTLRKEGVLQLSLEGLSFALRDGVSTVSINGDVTPLVGAGQGLRWPSFRVSELSIDSRGRVKLEGGWLDLREQYSLNLYGFRLEISKLGFGSTDDGGKWIGFSGGLKLVEGLSAGASVEGLRVTWFEDARPPKLTLEGVGVEFEVPGVVRFKGAVSYRELPGNVRRFDGDIKLNLISLGVQVDAALVLGTADGADGRPYTFMAIHLAAELPAGIPLWSTGLALYGMQGLFALQMEPDRRPEEEWYAIGGTGSWYHRGTPGVTDLRNKWRNQEGSLALGAGVTLGTLADNGFTFSGRVLLVLVFPGPIVMLEGRANLLKERARLSDEPVFRALAVLDGRAGTFLAGMDAQYRDGAGGELIDIRGGAEAFFSLSDGSAWHLYLGEKEPREKRIRAGILRLFEANAYFMLDARQLAVGAWIGYDRDWRFGPLLVELEAWAEANAVISWKPAHLYGDLWLHGHVGLSAFGIGISATVDARLTADVFDPFHIVGEFGVGINLPWPLPDLEAHVTVEWGPEPVRPPLPVALKEIAVEHFKVTTSWPLPRGTLLLPNVDRGDGFLSGSPPSANPADAPPAAAGIPLVPLDARPHLTFGRPVHDRAAVGVNPQPVTPEWERLGDPARNEGPARVRYGLEVVAIDRWNEAEEDWDPVARSPQAPGTPRLYGSWAPVPALPGGGAAAGSDPPVGQVKLWLWSRTPFDYTRHTGRAWDEWFTSEFAGYPCIPPAPDRRVCCGFGELDPGPVRPPLGCGAEPGLAIMGDHELRVELLDPPVQGESHGVAIRPRAPLRIELSEPAREVELLVSLPPAEDRRCVDFREREGDQGPNPRVEEGVSFLVREYDGKASPASYVATGPWGSGLDCRYGAEITPPDKCDEVECTLAQYARAPVVRALDAEGKVLAERTGNGVHGAVQTLKLRAAGIARVVVVVPQGETLLLAVCFRADAGAWGEGFDADGKEYGPFPVAGGRVRVRGDGIVRVALHAEGPAHLARMCATFGPDPAEAASRGEMSRHLQDSVARWSQAGEVLAPHSTYRVCVSTKAEMVGEGELAGFVRTETLTEVAYFRTGGPPGVTRFPAPAGHPGRPEDYQSGLDDLGRYVRQTVPATVPPPGVKALLPRPVYRAYDVGVEFNEDYVDLLYRIAGRDLGLYLYDNNNAPVRDAAGRLLVLANAWGRTEQLTLTESEARWVSLLDRGSCARVSTGGIPTSRTLGSSHRGQVLDGDTLYEARLVPLLLADDFNALAAGLAAAGDGARLGEWTVSDQVAGSPSRWEVTAVGTAGDRAVAQTSSMGSSDVVSGAVYERGTLLLRADDPRLPAGDPGQPGAWTDYRLSVFLRAGATGSGGVVVRYQDAGNYYRYSCDHGRGFRRLEKVVGGAPVVLAQDTVGIDRDRDYLVSVEAIGSSIRVFEDGAPVFAATDAALGRGRPGLYAWRHPAARFNDVRVDDFRAGAPVAYRFSFTTSRFASFFHHLHSYQDEVWPAALPAGPDAAALTAAAQASGTAPTAQEARGYDALASAALAAEARRDPARVEAHPVRNGASLAALVVRGPEPMDWARTEVQVSRAAGAAPAGAPPGAVKLTAASFGVSQPNEEAVDLLLREPLDPAGYRIEHRGFPGAPAADPAVPGTGPQTLLAFAGFTAESVAAFEIVDEGAWNDPSRWEAVGGVLRQTNNTYGGAAASPDKPGTYAITGDASWTDYRVRVRLSSHDDDAIGVVFRYRDRDNWYRFSMDRERGYRRLVRKAGGVTAVLWEDTARFELRREYVVALDAVGSRITGYMDGVRLFSVGDAAVASGRVGLYCWANVDARFAALRVERPGWLPFYTFGAEGRHPAGTRFRVHAGSASAAPPAVPGVEARFAGGSGPGRLNFASNGAELRVLAPSGGEEHRRELLPPGRYAPVAVRLLRKADGTGLAIVPTAGGALPEGRYRLRFTFHRDNRARDPGSQLLRQAGATGPEVVELDVPGTG